jgi:Cu+-exporting ATPase
MLLGKMFQIKSTVFLVSRDFKSYFPIALRINSDTSEESVPIYDIQKEIDYSSETKS